MQIHSVLSFYLILLSNEISEALYSFQCPVQAHWKRRSQTHCGSGTSYGCLYDQNNNNLVEFCRANQDFEAPGQKLIVAGSVQGTLQGANCDDAFYQPFQFLSSMNSRCAYRKSYCSEEGQTIFSNGSTLTDRLCRCDYTKSYDFIVRPNHRCYCVPTEEDCSCHLKTCSSNDMLSPDYECLGRNKWKTSFECDQIVPVAFPGDIDILSTVVPGFETYVPVKYELGKYSKQACAPVVLLISINVILPNIGTSHPEVGQQKYSLEFHSVIVLVISLLTLNYLSKFCKSKYSDVVSLSIEGTDEMIDDESVTVVANGLQEFQKETLREWSCKLNKFVPTRGADVIYNNTKSENVVIIVGPTGIGKSSIAYYAAFKLKQEDGYTIQPVRQPLDIQKLHVPGKNQIFIIDDFIGKSAVNKKAAVLWKNNETLLKIFSKTDQTKLILTSRSYIWQPESYVYLNIPFYTCDLLSKDLQLLPEERYDIYKSYCGAAFTKASTEEGIMMYSVFPSVCEMLSSLKQNNTNQLLTVLYLIIENELKQFKIKSRVSFIALSILAIKHMISKNSLAIDNNEHDELLQDLFHESTFLQYQSKHRLYSTLISFKGDYIREFHNCFVFIDETMQNIVLCCIAKTFMKSVIKHCKIDVILNQMRLYCINEEPDVLTIPITRENKKAYFQRIVTELKKGLHEEVFKSVQNAFPEFRVRFRDYMKHNLSSHELIKTQDGMTALHVVSTLGYPEYVSLFIHDKQMINEIDTAGNIPLHLACMNGHIQVVTFLVKTPSSVNISNNEGLKPFIYACENGFVNVAKYMLLYLSKLINVNEKYRTRNKKCALHLVCGNGDTNIAMLLLSYNAEVDIKDADGCTPLHLACYNGNSGTVSALIEHDANVDAVDSFGRTPVYIACSKNNQRVLQRLLEKEAKVNKKTVSGMTALRVSCKNENIAFVNMLLQSGAKVNSKQPNPVPLHEACTVGNESILNILIQSKASVNHKTKEGITPLHEACRHGHAKIVKILLDNKADVNEKDKQGWTALFFSSKYGFSSIVDLLLQNGANLNISDEDKVNELTLARQENHRAVIDLLKRSNSHVNECNTDN